MQIRTAEFEISASEVGGCPQDALPEFAFIGRSNVGKSSLINALTNRKNLCRVSKTPGRTRLINCFKVNEDWRLVDLPGYGFVKTGKKDRGVFEELIGRYFVEREGLSCCFVLIDSRHSPQTVDLDFTAWLTANAVPFVLVFTKADKLKPNPLQRNVDAFLKAMEEFSSALPRVLVTSAQSGEGRQELLKFIGLCLASSGAE